MITAQEARDSALGSPEIEQVLSEAERKIKNAASDGGFDCFLDISDKQHLYQALYDQLEVLGYEVRWNRAMLGFEISWRN